MPDEPSPKGDGAPEQQPDTIEPITISIQEFGKIMDYLACIDLQVKALQKIVEEHKRQIVELERVAEKAKRYL